MDMPKTVIMRYFLLSESHGHNEDWQSVHEGRAVLAFSHDHETTLTMY
jgi:hypothetical protein